MGHIFLYGPPGTGKSTLGKALAQSLALPFVDLDRVVESTAGMSIAQIMAIQGEPAFRDMESTALRESVGYASSAASPAGDRVTELQDKVIALGGGALLREENRVLAEAHGTVILLMAELETLLRRLKRDAGRRPLLAGDVQGKLTSLLSQRRDHYSSFAHQLNVDGGSTSQTVRQIQVRLGRFHLRAMGEYDVLVESVDRLGALLKERELGNPILVTDQNVAKLHAERLLAALQDAGFHPALLTIPAGEGYKTLDTVQRLWHGFLEHGLDRRSTVVALGGGVIGDLAGFAASTYMRGTRWVCVPTTLLAMVDASLGGKTGFDLPEGKNLIGSFFPPRLVLADPEMLKTLPDAEFTAGLAEVVKHGIISDPEVFDLCAQGPGCVRDHLEHIVKRAMGVKIQIIEQDPYEKGFRAALNLGHTVGHAVELVSQFRLRHGEAVAIGMASEARLAEKLAIARDGLFDRISDVLLKLGLPVRIPDELSRVEILRAMRVDKKKNARAIRFALPAEIGRVELVEVSDLEMALDDSR
jgi:shikimate kinase / 3-dehydroquinate synthase